MPSVEMGLAVDAPASILRDVLESVFADARALLPPTSALELQLERVSVALRIPPRHAAMIEYAARTVAECVGRLAAAGVHMAPAGIPSCPEPMPEGLALSVQFCVDSDATCPGGQPRIVGISAQPAEELRVAVALSSGWREAQPHPRWGQMVEATSALLEAAERSPAPSPALAAWLSDPRLLAALCAGAGAADAREAEALRAAIAPTLAPGIDGEAWERAAAEKNAHVLRPLPGGPAHSLFGAACVPDEWRAAAASGAFCMQRVPAQRPLRTLPHPRAARPLGHFVRGSYGVCGGRGAFGLFRVHAAGYVPSDPPAACPLAVAIAEAPAPPPPRPVLELTPPPFPAACEPGPASGGAVLGPPSPPRSTLSPPTLVSPSESGSSSSSFSAPNSPPPLRRAATHGGTPLRAASAETVVGRSLKLRKAPPASPAASRAAAASALAGLRHLLSGAGSGPQGGRCGGATLQRTHSNALQLHRAGSFPSAFCPVLPARPEGSRQLV